MTITREQILASLHTEWGTLVERFQRLSPEAQVIYLQQQGYARFADLLAHVSAWWQEGLAALPAILSDPAYTSPEVDVDQFNAQAVDRLHDLSEAAIVAIFSGLRQQWIDLVNDLSADFKNHSLNLEDNVSQKLHVQRVVAVGVVVFIFMVLTVGMLRANSLAQSDEPLVSGGWVVESLARSPRHIPFGVYDNLTNKTYVVFPGCINAANPCSVDPFITYYDHATKKRAGLLMLGESGPEIPPNGGRYDSHTYPQMLIDDQRYLHVFNSQHHGSPLQHYRITQPLGNVDVLNIANWQRLEDVDTAGMATYAIAIKAHDGEMYLFYRRTVTELTPSTLAYSPFAYVKSMDLGFTWTAPRDIIDPGDPSTYDTGWNTIYVKGIYYQADPERLHMVFGVHKNHNELIDKLFYTAFNFSNEQLYAPDGYDFGPVISATAILSNSHNIQIASEGVISSAYRTAAIGINPAGNMLNIFLSTGASGKRTIDRLIWTGTKWERVHLFWNQTEYHVDPEEVRFVGLGQAGLGQFELYVRKLGVEESPSGTVKSSIERWIGTATSLTTCSWLTDTIAVRTDPGITLVLRSFALVQNAHPAFKATYLEGGPYTSYLSPTNTGVLWVWGKSHDIYLPLIKRGTTP